MNAPHTPYPWRVSGQRIEYGPMVAGDGFCVAKVMRDPPEHLANSHLLARAPFAPHECDDMDCPGPILLDLLNIVAAGEDASTVTAAQARWLLAKLRGLPILSATEKENDGPQG